MLEDNLKKALENKTSLEEVINPFLQDAQIKELVEANLAKEMAKIVEYMKNPPKPVLPTPTPPAPTEASQPTATPTPTAAAEPDIPAPVPISAPAAPVQTPSADQA